jgi:hypothetical protein
MRLAHHSERIHDMSDSTTNNYSPAPWSYIYNPYTMSKAAAGGGTDIEIPAFEIYDADGNKILDTNEDSPEALQEANARLAAEAPEMLLSLIECANLLADYDESNGEEGEAYRRAIAIIEQIEGSKP